MGSSRNGENLGQRLLELKEDLDEKKSERSEAQGELKSIMRQLKEEFGVGSLTEAEKQIDREEKELQKLGDSIQAQVEEIEELMEGGGE